MFQGWPKKDATYIRTKSYSALDNGLNVTTVLVYRRELYLAISSSPVTKTMYMFSNVYCYFVWEKKIFNSAPGRLDDPSRVPS